MSKPIGPGDKCIVVRSINPGNVMKLVVVEEIVRPGEMPGTPPPPLMHWDATTVPCAVVRSLGSMIEVGTGGLQSPVAKCPIANLRRLDDDDDQLDKVEDRELEKESA